MAVEGTNLIIGGVLYIIAAVIIYLKDRGNKYDRGFVWVMFALMHGIDELADGINEAFQPTGQFHEILEKTEVITFALAGTFLIAGILHRVTERDVALISLAGVLATLPFIILVAVSPTALIDEIKGHSITIGVSIDYFTIFFGVLATAVYAIVLIAQSTQYLSVLGQLSERVRGQVIRYSLQGFMLLLYVVSELLVPISSFFVYLEVLAIFVVVLSPQELILTREKSIQLYLVYEESGLPVTTLKLNSNIPYETLNLVTGFLTAINVMAKDELQLGQLEEISTEKGFLISERRGRFLFAFLVEEVSSTIRKTFEELNASIEEKLEAVEYDATSQSDVVMDEIEMTALTALTAYKSE